jgi:TetR/AcrR family transcriptional regulator
LPINGVAATSFSTIAKRAGLTPAMVHYYFRDREQLLDALVDERLFPFISCVWKPVEPDGDPAEMIRGVVSRLLRGIERAPWIPSIWMREILNEGGLLRAKVMGRLPFEKVRIVAQGIRQGQAEHKINPELNPLLTVFSAIGLVMLHMATARVWADIFRRRPLSRRVLRNHIAGLLLDGLRHSPSPTETTPRKKR